MINWVYDPDYFVMANFTLNIGDLVTTILGEYGIIVGFGKHTVYDIDKTNYYHVLINDNVQYYLPFALIKIEKKV